MALKKMLLLLACVTQTGCGSTPVSKPMQPAVLALPSAATSKVLSQTVSRALNGTKVSLATGVLTKTSDFQLERLAQNTNSMPGLHGSLLGMPKVYRFSLKMSASSDCYLIYVNTGQAFPLDVKCRAL